MDEVFEFASQKAFEDFGISQSSFSMEISKLILIAKEYIENGEKENICYLARHNYINIFLINIIGWFQCFQTI
jgi:hypothetical protein